MNLVICSILTLAALAPAPEIAGTIVDYNGRLVSGVPVSVIALYANQIVEKTLSGSDGSFHFTDLALGAYGLEAKTDSGAQYLTQSAWSVLRTSCAFDWLRDCAKPRSRFRETAREWA
jgi:hypothetical protein